MVKFLNFVTDDLGVDGITISPGFAYERAPDQEHFIKRSNTKNFLEICLKPKLLKNGTLVILVCTLIFLLEINPTPALHGVIQQETFLVGRNPVIFWEKDM